MSFRPSCALEVVNIILGYISLFNILVLLHLINCFYTHSHVTLEVPHWSQWANWTLCSKSCGGGQRSRERVCIGGSQGDGSCVPDSDYIESESCNIQPCEGIRCNILQKITDIRFKNIFCLLEFQLFFV